MQPEVNFKQVNRAEIVSQLHGKVQPRASYNCSLNWGEISARAETIKSHN
jgi:hypothetical protein